MTTKHFRAFAQWIATERHKIDEECRTHPDRATLRDAPWAQAALVTCHNMVVAVATKFSPRFDKDKFWNACFEDENED